MKGLLTVFLIVLGFVANSTLASNVSSTQMYGYINGYWEDVDDQSAIDSSGNKTTIRNASEFDVPNLNFIVQSEMSENKAYLNMSGAGAGNVVVSNAWVEKDLYGERLAFRIGKLYRPFGLYNEKLDAVPTYIGIEPPELFDGDHLLLTRTTNLMIRGRSAVGEGSVNYALTTGNDERASSQTPLGADVNYTLDTVWKIGTSYYSSGGDAKRSKDVGSGSPDGAVLNWMDRDSFQVYGVYLQYMDEYWTFQVAGYSADHEATRNTTQLTTLCAGGLTSIQRERFNCSGTKNTNGNYKVSTYYFRAGYNFNGSFGQVTPYFQYDYYKNPETVFDKSLGGDKEAGLADDGSFVKLTSGVSYRPNVSTALKVDYSIHMQEVGGADDSYGEVRFSYSYFWRL